MRLIAFAVAAVLAVPSTALAAPLKKENDEGAVHFVTSLVAKDRSGQREWPKVVATNTEDNVKEVKGRVDLMDKEGHSLKTCSFEGVIGPKTNEPSKFELRDCDVAAAELEMLNVYVDEVQVVTTPEEPAPAPVPE